jgi:transcription initiation factor TFIIIB Brf1 subunit/transcription initiation factor TFIIB
MGLECPNCGSHNTAPATEGNLIVCDVCGWGFVESDVGLRLSRKGLKR